MSLKDIILGGVIDSDFRRNISVILTNTSDRIVEIEVGNRMDWIGEWITFYRQIEKMADKITIEEFVVCHNLACNIQFI